MRFSLLLVVLVVLVSSGDAAMKKRKKFEGDFEFAEDSLDNSRKVGDKKTWIFDPDSDLCQALMCRKEERCLLENAYTAVCVSRSEIKRNGDKVVPRNYRSTTTSTTARSMDDEEEDYDEDDFNLKKVERIEKDLIDLNENEDNGDLGLEFYDLDVSDGRDVHKVKTSAPLSSFMQKCTPCPVVKPDYICGTDNSTYSSSCKLDYYNCWHDTSVKVACKGFCPCPVTPEQRKKEKQTERLSKFENKYKSTIGINNLVKPGKVIFAPDVAKFKQELFGNKKKDESTIQLDLSTDKHRQRGYNDVLPDKKDSLVPNECSETTLNVMGNRLLDWFSVLMGQPGQKKHFKSKVRFSSSCAKEVVWMFGNLDVNQDNQLSMSELYDLEHNERENCLKPFLDRCDDNRDIFLSGSEWCRCFSQSDRPCVAMRRRAKPNLLGAYVPTCDTDGFFLPAQCHSAVGTCWCVDKHGVEQNGSRARGRPDCESVLQRNGLMDKAEIQSSPSIDETDDSDEMDEGSGDY